MRVPWASVLLVAVVVAALALWATGRLELHWEPDRKVAERDDHEHGKGEKDHTEEERVHGDKAILDAEAVKAAGLRAEHVRVGSVAVSLELSGEVQVPDERVARVTPRVSGVVREIYRARGEAVEAGGALAAIESAEFGDARAAFDTAVTELRLAETNVQAWKAAQSGAADSAAGSVGWLELDQALSDRAAGLTDKAVTERAAARMKELHERGLRSRTELLAAEADLERARSRAQAAARRVVVLGAMADNELTRARQRLDAAQAKLRALGGENAAGAARGPARVMIRSPIAGVVTTRDVTVGQTVEPSAKLFTVADLSELWVAAAAYDRDVAAVREGQRATIRAQGVGDTVLTGRVIRVGTEVDEKTRTLPVRVAVQNRRADGAFVFRPGMFATVALETARKGDVPVVPTAAIQWLDGRPVVFVETPLSEGAAYQRRAVKLGARDQDVIEIVDGVAPGERVVVANAYLLKSEFERSRIGHGHAH